MEARSGDLVEAKDLRQIACPCRGTALQSGSTVWKSTDKPDGFSVSRQLVALGSFGAGDDVMPVYLSSTGINGASGPASIIPHTEIVSTNTTGPTRPVSQQPSEKSSLSCTSSMCVAVVTETHVGSSRAKP